MDEVLLPRMPHWHAASISLACPVSASSCWLYAALVRLRVQAQWQRGQRATPFRLCKHEQANFMIGASTRPSINGAALPLGTSRTPGAMMKNLQTANGWRAWRGGQRRSDVPDTDDR
jgi:hypothetical protein